MRSILLALVAVLALAACDTLPANEVDPDRFERDQGGDY